MVFFPEAVGIPSLRALARKLLELLSDYETEKEPLLFHVFSNSGASLYRYVQEPADPALLPPACGGTTFDSSPGDKSLVGSLRALLFLTREHSVALRMLFVVAVTLSLLLFRFLFPSLAALYLPHQML